VWCLFIRVSISVAFIVLNLIEKRLSASLSSSSTVGVNDLFANVISNYWSIDRLQCSSQSHVFIFSSNHIIVNKLKKTISQVEMNASVNKNRIQINVMK